MQEDEIQECLWMPVEEFLADEGISEFTKSIVLAGIESPGMVKVDTRAFPRMTPASSWCPVTLQNRGCYC